MRYAWFLILAAGCTSTPDASATPDRTQQAAALYKEAKAATDPKLALEKLNAALAVEPNFAQALVMRANLRRDAGDLDAAENDLTRSMAACAPNRRALYRFLRGSFYHQSRKDVARAEEDYNEAVHLEAEHPDAYQVDILMHRALLYMDSQRPRLAMADYETILGKNPDEQTRSEVIEWYMKAGAMEAAASASMAKPKQP